MEKLNSSRVRLEQEIKAFSELVESGSLLLDAGSGHSPYQQCFSHALYFSTDLMRSEREYSKPSFICDLTNIPIKTNGFNHIVFTQVVEHLMEPESAIKELQRILIPGGLLLISGPLFYEEHEAPYDFRRFTQYGLREMFKKVNLSIIRLDWLEGFFGTAAYEFEGLYRFLPGCRHMKNHKTKPLDWFTFLFLQVVRLFSKGLAYVFHKLELKYKYTDKGFPKNYICILTKKNLS